MIKLVGELSEHLSSLLIRCDNNNNYEAIIVTLVVKEVKLNI